MNSKDYILESGIPDFSKINQIDLVAEFDATLAEADKIFARVEGLIESRNQYSWSEMVEPLDQIEIMIANIWGPISHLFGVMNSADLRKVYESCQPKLVQFGLKMSQSKKLYSLYKTFKENASLWQNLNRARQRIVEHRLLDAQLSGIGLEGEVQKRFNEISQKLADLQMKFSNNVLDSTKQWSLTLKTKHDVKGLPDRVLALAAQDWAKANNTSANPSEGPWRFTLDMPSYIPFMEYSESRFYREEMYRARIAIASQDQFDNNPIIDSILDLRKEKAKILGFNSFAELSLASKMAGRVEAVDTLLESLRRASYEVGMKEHKELNEYSLQNGADSDLAEWDVPYWARRLKEDKFNFNEDELRPYFPIPKVLNGLFDLVHRIFGIRIERADQEVPVWHPDVMFFKIFDVQSQKHIASFFLDPYSRPENKRGGAWMGDCVNRHIANGKIVIPVAYLICNGTPPVGNQPGLMSFTEVNTLFHEFGHGLQHMLTTVDELAVSGISGVEWDAVELASQFMENWLYDEKTLKTISEHFETKKPLPQDYIEKIKATKNYRAASAMLRQLQFAISDIELHHRYDKAKETSHEVALRISKTTSAFKPRPEGRMLCSFSHIFAGGYSAGYYSYKWAEVLSADAFGAFEEVGFKDDKKLAEVGNRYRSTILAKGGSEHPMVVYKSFRGREPSTDALLRHNGLK